MVVSDPEQVPMLPTLGSSSMWVYCYRSETSTMSCNISTRTFRIKRSFTSNNQVTLMKSHRQYSVRQSSTADFTNHLWWWFRLFLWRMGKGDLCGRNGWAIILQPLWCLSLRASLSHGSTIHKTNACYSRPCSLCFHSKSLTQVLSWLSRVRVNDKH